jgi:hypothetical protein
MEFTDDDIAAVTAPGIATLLRDGAPPFPLTSPPYCGLTNQGTTCYLNSVVQALLYVDQIRRAALAAFDGSDDAGSNIQLLFARMCLGLKAAQDMNALTRSFGWREDDVFVQHDASELLSILIDKLALLGGSWAGIRTKTTGRMPNTVICTVCSCTRRRVDDLCGLAVAVPQASLWDRRRPLQRRR